LLGLQETLSGFRLDFPGLIGGRWSVVNPTFTVCKWMLNIKP
jgi:hypothetical protein